MQQQEYTNSIKRIKKYDTMPYEDIVLIENTLNNSDGNYTVKKLYNDLSKEMSKEIFYAIIKYLLTTTRLRIDKKTGIIHRSWNPVYVKKIMSKGLTVY